MEAVPAPLLDGLSPEQGERVGRWWAGLTEADRTQVAALCDSRRDACFFGATGDRTSPVPVVIGGRFVPRDDAAGWAEWHAELFDHLLCNPELVIFGPPAVRTFHICTRHAAARSVLQAGRIPADFRCPLGAADCPMQTLLSHAPAHPSEKSRMELRLCVVT